MKATETKTSAAQAAKKTAPFFRKGAGQGFFKPAAPAVQTKLTVGDPGDSYEQEADAMADQVVQKKEAKGVGGEVAMAKSIRRKPIFESKNEPEFAQRKCAACEKEEAVQRKSSAEGSAMASPAVESGIAGSRGSGSALPTATQQQMESSFGADFSGVRIHDNSSAQQMNKELNAQAFTHGKDIYFGAGKYKPQSSEGQHLLAHELTHVVQQTGKGNKKIQRAGGPPGKKKKPTDPGPQVLCSFPPGTATVEQVTKDCPSLKGHIEQRNGKWAIVINKVRVKSNSNDEILSKLKDKEMPKPKSRKDNPTEQRDIWEKVVKNGVEKKLGEYVANINKSQKQKKKESPTNLYILSLKKGRQATKIVGTYEELVEQCIIPKWNTDGVPKGFQVEHVIDYQIAGKDAADQIDNLMLLESRDNNRLGQIIADWIHEDVFQILNHYNNFVKPGILVKNVYAARMKYMIIAADFDKVDTRIKLTDDNSIYRNNMTYTNAKLNPLKEANITVESFKQAPKDYFILKTQPDAAGIILPYKADAYRIGNYELTIEGSEKDGLKDIKAKLVVHNAYTADKDKKKKWKVEPDGDKTKVYIVKDFGYYNQQLKIKYLSIVEFPTLKVDEQLNVVAEGMINHPTPSFLNNTPIEVSLRNSELYISKELSASNLGRVGPIKVDEADLLLELNTGGNPVLSVTGGVDFSIDKIGKGHINASAGENGFYLKGSFEFDKKTFDVVRKVEVGYSSADDVDGGHPWTISGQLSISEKKVKGIQHADITVSYDKGILNFSGQANLTVPGIKWASIEGSYDGKTFSLNLKGKFDFESKYIKKGAELSLTLATGGDDGGMKLGLSGTVQLTLSPKIETMEARVSYDQGDFSAEVSGAGIKISEKVKGAFTFGITNRQVDADGNAQKGSGGGKGLRFYGRGALTVHFTDDLWTDVGIKVTPEGKVLLSAEIALVNKPLLKGENLFHGNYPIFKLDTGDIILFSVGVGDVYVNIGGWANAFYDIGIPMISGKLGAKDVDVFDESTFNLQGELGASIKAEAGIDMHAHIEIGASILRVLKGYGAIDGALMLHGAVTLTPSLKISYSPQTGLKINNIDLDLNALIKATGTLSGEIGVKLDLFFKTIGLWSHTWDLGSADLGELGNVHLHFPIYTGANGEITKPGEKSLKPESPFSDESAGKQFMKGKVSGGDDDPNISRDVVQEKARKEFHSLPAIGPANPQYRQVMNRHRFVQEAFDRDGPVTWMWIVPEWMLMEYQEFEELKVRLRTPESSENKIAVLHDFAMNHPKVAAADIAMLENEIRIVETPKKI